MEQCQEKSHYLHVTLVKAYFEDNFRIRLLTCPRGNLKKKF